MGVVKVVVFSLFFFLLLSRFDTNFVASSIEWTWVIQLFTDLET